MTQWTFQPVAGPIVIGLIAAALLGLFFLKPAFSSATRKRRSVLSALRLLGTLMVIVALLRPGCVRTVEKEQSAVLLLMCDISRSMQLPHKREDETRWAALRQTIDEHSDKLRELNEQNILIRVVGFDGQTYPVKFEAGKIALPDEPDGGTTDIGSSLGQALQSLRSERLAAVVVLSDGVQNEANPRIELPQSVNELVQLQTPLYAIPFGQEGNAGQFSDIAVENMADQFSVFVKNELVIKATIRTSGFVNQQIPIRLLLEDSSGERKTVHTELVTVPKDGYLHQLNIPFVPQEAGQFKLILQADEQPAELVTRNNRLPAFLTVYDGGLRVLYVYGSLTAEQRYLKNSIGASPDIQFDFFPVSPANRAAWPLDRSDLFDASKYDVFIFSDVDSRAFFQKNKLDENRLQEKNFSELVRAIENGAGFMMMGGAHSFGPGLYHQTPLADLLPVEMDDFEKQDFDTPLMKAYHLDGPLNVVQVENHFLTNFTDEDSSPIWKNLPPLPGANRFKDVRRTSRVLLETENGEPILIADNAGGRILAMSADTTWLWFTHDYQDFHRRFWRQVVLWLAGRDGQEEGNVWINLSQRRFTQGIPVAFTAGAREPTGQPIPNADFRLDLVNPDGIATPLLSTRKSGVISGQIEPEKLTQPGTWQLQMLATKDGTTIGQTFAEFILFDQDKEKANPVADPALMNRIASQTREFGGRSLPPEEFSNLLEEIGNRPLELKIEVPESWKLGETLPDGLAFLFGMVVLLGGEWFLRKKWGMV